MDYSALCAALGITLRSLQRHRRGGCPMPADGESIETWAPRAKAWIADHRKKSGPKPLESKDPKADAALLRWRTARAKLAELQLERERAKVHSREECERAAIARLQELQAAFARLPAKLGRRLMHAPSPDFIQQVVEEELRHAFESLARGEVVDDGGGQGEAAAG
ncbi:MAG: hypothetical protein EKK55_13770 [Rhodocyclaceae bacterium]|nr:MAG: hypothetical protein EKK55_13770 [Rhodocyclaceae bacterium]